MSLTKVPTRAEIAEWPVTVNVREANRALGVSDSHGYELIARGEYPFKTLRVGGRIRVLTASIVKVLSGEE
jgi:predicted DNA-binding transcriptional regulator AlpA